jgi:hypothetical protein
MVNEVGLVVIVIGIFLTEVSEVCSRRMVKYDED